MRMISCVFFNDTATTEIYTLSLHDALPICRPARGRRSPPCPRPPCPPACRSPPGAGSSSCWPAPRRTPPRPRRGRSEEHTSELQSRQYLVCRLLLDKTIKLLPRKHDYISLS